MSKIYKKSWESYYQKTPPAVKNFMESTKAHWSNGYRSNEAPYTSQQHTDSTLNFGHEGHDLGGGFRFFETTYGAIQPNSFSSIRLTIPTNLRVINAGWSCKQSSRVINVVESFPRHLHQWIVTIYNPSRSPIEVNYYLWALAPQAR